MKEQSQNLVSTVPCSPVVHAYRTQRARLLTYRRSFLQREWWASLASGVFGIIRVSGRNSPTKSTSADKVRPFSIVVQDLTLLQHGDLGGCEFRNAVSGDCCGDCSAAVHSWRREYSACLAWAEDQGYLFFELWNMIRDSRGGLLHRRTHCPIFLDVMRVQDGIWLAFGCGPVIWVPVV